jgi:hypothetical protein
MAHLPNNPDKDSQYDRRLPVHLSVRRKYSSSSYVCYRIEQDPFPSTYLHFVLTIWGPNMLIGGALRKHTQPQQENLSRQIEHMGAGPLVIEDHSGRKYFSDAQETLRYAFTINCPDG